MSLLYIIIPSAVVLIVAYRLYGNLLERLLELDPTAPTPAPKPELSRQGSANPVSFPSPGTVFANQLS